MPENPAELETTLDSLRVSVGAHLARIVQQSDWWAVPHAVAIVEAATKLQIACGQAGAWLRRKS